MFYLGISPRFWPHMFLVPYPPGPGTAVLLQLLFTVQADRLTHTCSPFQMFIAILQHVGVCTFVFSSREHNSVVHTLKCWSAEAHCTSCSTHSSFLFLHLLSTCFQWPVPAHVRMPLQSMPWDNSKTASRDLQMDVLHVLHEAIWNCTDTTLFFQPF